MTLTNVFMYLAQIQNYPRHFYTFEFLFLLPLLFSSSSVFPPPCILSPPLISFPPPLLPFSSPPIPLFSSSPFPYFPPPHFVLLSSSLLLSLLPLHCLTVEHMATARTGIFLLTLNMVTSNGSVFRLLLFLLFICKPRCGFDFVFDQLGSRDITLSLS